jgi:hypothetical protein
VQPTVEIAGEPGGLIGSSRLQRCAATLPGLSAGTNVGAELLEPGGQASISGGSRRDDD